MLILSDQHAPCIEQLQNWAIRHPSINLCVETYELPLSQMRGPQSSLSPFSNKFSPAVDFVIIAHHAEVVREGHSALMI